MKSQRQPVAWITKGCMIMAEKKYLKWYHKIGYGSGDVAGNVVYALLTSFVMFYLTDTVGLSMGVVGTLMAVSKVVATGLKDLYRTKKDYSVHGLPVKLQVLGVKLLPHSVVMNTWLNQQKQAKNNIGLDKVKK